MRRRRLEEQSRARDKKASEHKRIYKDVHRVRGDITNAQSTVKHEQIINSCIASLNLYFFCIALLSGAEAQLFGLTACSRGYLTNSQSTVKRKQISIHVVLLH